MEQKPHLWTLSHVKTELYISVLIQQRKTFAYPAKGIGPSSSI